ncbi:MAG: hypothetical protein I3J03_07570 [Actinomyces succiniciruminis]|nr:hypothetical protein [Actinomyces succiniciruminis]
MSRATSSTDAGGSPATASRRFKARGGETPRDTHPDAFYCCVSHHARLYSPTRGRRRATGRAR